MRLLLAGWLAGALWAAAAPRAVTFFDEAVTVAPGQIRTLAIPGAAALPRIVCFFEVREGGAGVRAVLLTPGDAELWVQGRPHSILASTGFVRRGALSHRPASAGPLVLALDNRLEGHSAAEVHLLVRLMPEAGTPGAGRPADRARSLILVWSSMGLFGAVAFSSAVRIRRNFLRRRGWREIWL